MKKFFLYPLIPATLLLTTLSCKNDVDESEINTPSNNNPEQPIPNKISGKQFIHRVLIDKATGLQCPNCPRMTYAIERIKKTSIGDKIIAVSMFGYTKDIFYTEQTNWWCRNYYDCKGYPSAYINKIKQPISIDTNTISRYIKDSSPVGIKINSKITSSEATINATFQFNQAYQGLKYTVYILENGIKALQQGAGMQTHNHVFTKCKWNEDIGTVSNGQQITKTTSFPHKMHSKGTTILNNLDVVVYVTDSNGKCIQVQKAKANTTKDFDFK